MTPTAIAQARVAEKVNRLDAEHLAYWRHRYNLAKQDFVNGAISHGVFTGRLAQLGFRHDALRAEVTDAERFKAIPVRYR